jgi:hypothetical protein
VAIREFVLEQRKYSPPRFIVLVDSAMLTTLACPTRAFVVTQRSVVRDVRNHDMFLRTRTSIHSLVPQLIDEWVEKSSFTADAMYRLNLYLHGRYVDHTSTMAHVRAGFRACRQESELNERTGRRDTLLHVPAGMDCSSRYCE